jgi:hypothetical protein
MKTISQIITKNDNILFLDYPFKNLINKDHIFFKNTQDKMNIRIKNLHDIIDIFKDLKIDYWLQGKTLLGLYRYKTLLKDDTDEDIGTMIDNLQIVCNKVIPKLIEKGFEVIRATQNNSMVSLLRNKRYVDICFFKKQNNYIGYEKKKFPLHLFQEFISVSINNYEYTVPKYTDKIIKYSYNL